MGNCIRFEELKVLRVPRNSKNYECQVIILQVFCGFECKMYIEYLRVTLMTMIAISKAITRAVSPPSTTLW